MKEAIAGSLRTLQEQYDWILIEGAGSPAEINRREEDLANHFTASLAGAPVLLVSSMELGGAFAAVAGTLTLLPPAARASVKGFLFNKYDGPLSLLELGTRILEERYGIPFLGAIPYLEGLRIPDEDGGTYTPVCLPDAGQFSLPEIDNSLDRMACAVEKLFTGWV
ncbi:MAG: AAA family ATPase [Bacteroides sp.]|nr:AAA family ATPase [Bacteroides sp.]